MSNHLKICQNLLLTEQLWKKKRISFYVNSLRQFPFTKINIHTMWFARSDPKCDCQVTITFRARKSTLRAKYRLKTIRSSPICNTKNHLLHFKNKLRWFRACTKFQLNFRNSFLAQNVFVSFDKGVLYLFSWSVKCTEFLAIYGQWRI